MAKEAELRERNVGASFAFSELPRAFHASVLVPLQSARFSLQNALYNYMIRACLRKQPNFRGQKIK
jgi:hypothetical protein